MSVSFQHSDKDFKAGMNELMVGKWGLESHATLAQLILPCKCQSIMPEEESVYSCTQ